MPTTYDCIATTTLSSAAASVTFSSISGSYTDLVVVVNVLSNSTNDDLYMQVGNGSVDTGSNYSYTTLRGNGTSTLSTRASNQSGGFRLSDYSSPTTTSANLSIMQIQNYSNTTTYKTAVNRGSNGSTGVDVIVSLWRSTSAINIIKIYPSSGNMASGSTFTLYGILAA